MNILVTRDGSPKLDQFSEEGFIDCVFRIQNLRSTETHHSFHLDATHENDNVGIDVEVYRGIKRFFDDEMEAIKENVYHGGVRFYRSGEESDRLITALAQLYDFEVDNLLMINSFSFTAIALTQDKVNIDCNPVKIKLFGNDAEDCKEDDYFESFFNIDIDGGFVYWNEKDQDYREPLIRGLSNPNAI